MKKIKNYINGEFLESSTKNKIDNINPATGKIISTFPRSNHNDIALAVNVAKKSFLSWKNLSINKRAGYLIKLGEEIKKNANELAAVPVTAVKTFTSFSNNLENFLSRFLDH